MLEDYIRIHAEQCPDKVAVVEGDKQTTYSQLWNMVLQHAERFKAEGLGERQVKIFRTTQTLDFLVDYFAIHIVGAVAMPLEKDIPEERFLEVENRYGRLVMPEGVADILFTTGTTGVSKGVMVSHEAILADAENLIDGQGFSSELAFVISGPLNHIGSLSKVYPVMMLGATLVVLEGMTDMDLFFKAFQLPYQKMATFLVPASIRILLKLWKKELVKYASKIDFIETGAAPMMQSDMQELAETLPQSRLYNTYASTETGIVCTYNFNDGLYLAGCVGEVLKNAEVFTDIDGRISCRGRMIMSGYADEPELSAAVMRDGTVFTSDIGYFDEAGRLHLTGRMDDVINVGGYKVSPSEVEDAAMAIDGVRDCICVAVEHPVMGNALKLVVAMRDGETLDKRKIARFLAGRLERYKVPMVYEQTNEVRRTYNGKLDRKSYRS